MESRRPGTQVPTRPERIITVILAAWLLASGALNILHRDTPSYLTVRYAGLEGFFPLLLLWLVLTGIGLGLLRIPARDGLDLAGRLLFAAWIVFAGSLLPHLGPSLSLINLLLVAVAALALARDVLRSAWRTRFLPDVALTLAGIAQVAVIASRTPWTLIWSELAPVPAPDSGPLLILALVWLALIGALIRFWRRPNQSPFPRGGLLVLALGVFLLQSLLIGRIMYARVATLSTPTYDFNLFAQMFHQMAETLTPVTTLERNLPLSHFKVHLSPIYYLLLPFYLIWRSPEALNVFQAVVVASGIFPLILIARQLKLRRGVTASFAVIFLVSAPLITSNFYDLHENCFLVPLLLWLIWALERRSDPAIALFTGLTLLVKEDAALYVWALAAFAIFDRRMLRQGLAMLLVSGGYFLWAVRYLTTYGDGAMTGRFHNLIGVPEWSLLAVPYSLWRNPGFVLAKIIQVEKFPYLIQMLAPLGFIPLLTRSLPRWILLIPFLLMNLMVDYPYQFNIHFQYNYGPYILLLYLTLLWVADLPEARSTQPTRKSATAGSVRPAAETTASPEPVSARLPAAVHGLLAVAIASGLLISGYHLLDYESYPQRLREDRASLDAMKAVMDQIPAESSVLASDFLTGYLAQRESLYDISYNFTGDSYFPADFIVIDLRPGYSADHEALVPRFLSDGYEIRTHRLREILVLEYTGVKRPDLQ